MLSIIGIVCLFVFVFGGYMFAGGNMSVILHALPHEMIIIGGAAVAAFLIANPSYVLKDCGKSIMMTFKGSKWKKKDYTDLLLCLYELLSLHKKEGEQKLEAEIEKPNDSKIFSKYPKILKDDFALSLIRDYFRGVVTDFKDPHEVEGSLEEYLEKYIHEKKHSVHALNKVSDGLPALGIVAAVLGVIKTMGSITEPPEVLGGMIGGALVGTFLGVFLAYGLVGPIAQKIESYILEDQQFYLVFKKVITTHLSGKAPQLSIEEGRKAMPSHGQPSFQEMEELINNMKKG